jgi:hypothetical protein
MKLKVAASIDTKGPMIVVHKACHRASDSILSACDHDSPGVVQLNRTEGERSCANVFVAHKRETFGAFVDDVNELLL